MKKSDWAVSVLIALLIFGAVIYFKYDPMFRMELSEIEKSGMPLENAKDDAGPLEASSFYSKLIKLRPEDPAGYIGRGKAYRSVNANQKALADFNKAIERDRKNAEVHLMRGEVSLDMKGYGAAAADCEAALDLGAGGDRVSACLARAHAGKGERLYTEGQYENAAGEFTDALKYSAGNLEYLVWRAASNVLAGRYEVALPDLDRVLADDPRNEGASLWRGKAHFYLMRDDLASTDLKRAMKSENSDIEPFYYLAWIKLDGGDPGAAIAYCDTALAVDTDTAWARMLKGWSLFETGDFPAAAAQFDLALQLDPSSHNAYFGRAAAKIKRGNTPGAVEDYISAMGLDEPYEEYRGSLENSFAFRSLDLAGRIMKRDYRPPEWLGELFCLAGEYEKAVKQLGEAHERGPNEHEVYYWRGWAYSQLGRYTLALEDLDSAAVLDGEDAATFYVRGIVNRDARNFGAAIADFRKASELAPTDEKIRSKLVSLLMELKNYDAAMKTSRNWLQHHPESFQAALSLADATAGTGRYEEAVKEYLDAGKLAHDDFSRAKCYFRTGVAYMRMNSADNAEVAFDSALQLAPGNSLYLLHRGYAKLASRQISSARKDFQDVLSTAGPDSDNYRKDALYGLACAATADRNPREGLDYLGKAAEAGYDDLARAKQDDCLDPLRDMKEYEKIMMQILDNAR